MVDLRAFQLVCSEVLLIYLCDQYPLLVLHQIMSSEQHF